MLYSMRMMSGSSVKLSTAPYANAMNQTHPIVVWWWHYCDVTRDVIDDYTWSQYMTLNINISNCHDQHDYSWSLYITQKHQYNTTLVSVHDPEVNISNCHLHEYSWSQYIHDQEHKYLCHLHDQTWSQYT